MTMSALVSTEDLKRISDLKRLQDLENWLKSQNIRFNVITKREEI